MPLETCTPWIAGRGVGSRGRRVETVRAPFDGRALARMAMATEADLDAALAAARAAFAELRTWPRHARRDLLDRIARAIAAERRGLAALVAADCGKPVTQALGEVDRAVQTFSFAADEARRFGGELIPMDVDPRATGMAGLVQRFAIGPISAISPFNFPLNLLAHKLAPALAVGSAVVVKPPPQAPLAAFRLARILTECGAPAGACNVLPMDVPLAERLATDPAFALLSFTGSAKVGWHLKSVAGKKKVLLELGGNAAAVVHEDAADLDRVAERLALGSFAYAGQVCIKVQRVLVHRGIWRRFVRRFVEASADLKAGNPADPKTVVGPMIDNAALERVQAWVAEAESAGARVLLRGRRRGSILRPTVLTDVNPRMKVESEEVFGPVTTLTPYRDWSSALARVNRSPYGLQAGVFTADLGRVREAFTTLEVGGVIVNEFPTFRVDHYPYGGVKDSGFGREGVRYAMEEMSEPRMLVLK
ncbi:MAG TPA: aldehyde dehydrogenase family protein [Gemmatimonadales bacterium]|jgi:acyl-CoA reductase-like NAD-dependent aldehyde dehydrogenase|nr:aldehyde dehydrogenase family protein [Gemmatimonadales bacterium]